MAAQRAMAAANAKPQLLLPAPVPPSEQLTFFDIIQAQPERELVPIHRTASRST